MLSTDLTETGSRLTKPNSRPTALNRLTHLKLIDVLRHGCTARMISFAILVGIGTSLHYRLHGFSIAGSRIRHSFHNRGDPRTSTAS